MSNDKRKIISAYMYLAVLTVLLALTCFAFFGKSGAWFASNHRVNAGGMNMALCHDDSVHIGNISVYRVDENNNSATLYQNPSDDALADILTMNQYDSVFEENREHTPIIIKTTLENFKSGSDAAEVLVTVSLKNVTGYTETIGDKEVLMPFISNLVNISCSADSALNDVDMAPVDYYPYARDLLMEEEPSPSISSDSQTFVSYSGSGASTSIGAIKADSLTYRVEKPAGQTTLDVYLLFRYDENLIARFISDNGQRTALVGELDDYFAWGSEVTFLKDIAKISFTEATD